MQLSLWTEIGMGFFGGFLGGGNSGPSVTKTNRATVARIVNILGVRQLDTMPAQAAKAFQLASDSNAKAGEFVEVIESDEVLSARVIRIANSVYFFRGTPAHDIEKAVANIGLDELRCLLSASMLRSLLSARHPARDTVWANAVATGMLCRILARTTKHLGSGEAFLCGLLHDVGKLIMIRKNGALYDKVFSLVSTEEKNFMQAEEQVFELNHVEVGKWVAEEWNFPESALRTIALHHEPWPASFDKFTFDYPTLVKAADIIAHSLGIGHSASMRSFAKRATDERNALLPKLGIGPDLLEGIIRQFEQLYEKESALYQPEHS